MAHELGHLFFDQKIEPVLMDSEGHMKEPGSLFSKMNQRTNYISPAHCRLWARMLKVLIQ